MIDGGLRYAVGAAAVLVVVGVSGWGGYELAQGQCAERELLVAKAYLSNQDAAVAAAYRDADVATVRVAQVRRGQTAALSRVKELEHALSQLAHDPARNFTDDELQAFGSLRAAYAAGRRELPDGVRGRASGSESAQGLRAESAGLGLSLRQPAR